MIGINIENLDKLIKINNLNCSSLDDNINDLLGILNELDDCYSGKDISFIFSSVIEQKSNIRKIPSIVKNYSDILATAKTSYQHQDANVQQLINHVNPNG